MAVKKSTVRIAKESLTLSFSVNRYVSYADYYSGRSCISALEIKNTGTEPLTDVTVTLTDSLGLFLPFSRTPEEIPYESTLDMETGGILSPMLLRQVAEPTACKITASITVGKELIAEETAEITVLPFHYAEGLSGNLEGLSGFVRPHLADCQALLQDAKKQVQKWGGSTDLDGYGVRSRNDVRLIVAAVYTAMKKHHLSRRVTHMTGPFSAGEMTAFLSSEDASAVEAALFAASVLEAAGLHPIVGLGEETAFVGAWLFETCFVDAVSDDLSQVLRYASPAVGSVALFDIEDMFDGRNTSYATSEKNALAKLEHEEYTALLDVKRARMSHISPLPIRAKGRDTIESERFDAAPLPLPEARDLSVTRLPKNKQWERKLLDLSLKNNLLAFHPMRGAVRLFYPELTRFFSVLSEVGEVTLSPYPDGSETGAVLRRASHYSEEKEYDAYREITEMELRQKTLRAFGDTGAFTENMRALLRKSHAAEEETGAKVLYLAAGFLHFSDRESGTPCASPLLLMPVTLRRISGRGGYSLIPSEEGFEMNATLLEFLKAQFDIDIRGLDHLSGSMEPREIFHAVRAGIAGHQGFHLSYDLYLSVFSFARYAMWSDIRQNFTAYRKNKMVSSLVEGRNLLDNPALPTVSEDDVAPHEILTPLSADASQFDAVLASGSGASFVLHGPPGTGKSQTITNMIANALYNGKRVLFVAEKAAALSVVEKRLSAIGLSDFCLELHSSKVDKAEVIKKIENTLSLREGYTPTEHAGEDAHLSELREALRAPKSAMHKRRRLGVSIYEGIANCLKYKHAPDLFMIESGFFDALTKDSLEKMQVLLTNAAAAARECGGVRYSPFEGVNLTETDESVRNAVTVASELLTADIKNLKNYITLFLSAYRQRISTLTRQKTEGLYRLCGLLSSSELLPYLSGEGGELALFYSASRHYDSCVKDFLTRYKQIPDITKEYERIEAEADNWGENYRSSAVLSAILKKLQKAARDKIMPQDELSDIELLGNIHRYAAEIRSCKNLSRSFVERSGSFHQKHRADFMRVLYEVHELAASVMMEYNAAEMNAAIALTRDGHTVPLLQGLRHAIDLFRASEERFLQTLKIDRARAPEEDILTVYMTKAAALLDHIDMLPAFTVYRSAVKKLEAAGLSFIGDFMEKGTLNPENLVPAFLKAVYRNFLETNIPQDPVLSRFSSAVLEDTIEEFRMAADEYDHAAGELIRRRLIEGLPTVETEGTLSLELVAFQRLSKQPRGVTLRELVDKSWELLSVTSPCLLMSPVTVSQYLRPENGMFDLVIFDEASQMPTCEAVASLARARAAVVVGDRNQLPPTVFFQNSYVDEDNLETEDMESLLDEWLTLGLPERSLLRHYRSKHESLIAFSNAMYYKNRLLTFPSPDALESKVNAVYVPDGVYERGAGKYNRREAEELVKEVVARLSDPKRAASSIGVVTFSTAQQEYIDKLLQKEIYAKNLEHAAYEREEPLFVKNLENVQGDERDVILFSVCYGPDQRGRVSLNFGPLNQSGGWRRLNVAVSRAREEMIIYSSLTSAMIDPSRTGSQGVLGLRSFLRFAEKGRSTLPVRSDEIKINKNGMGRYIADELTLYGYECRANVGVSDFKIDVAVLDPRTKKDFILAILCDGSPELPVRDKNVLLVQTLKRNNWNVVRVFALAFYNNPKREVKRIKELLDRMTQPEGGKKGDELSRKRKPYRAAKLEPKETTAAYITSGDNNAEVVARLRAIVSAEEPITKEFLVRRCLASFGIQKTGVKLEAAMQACLNMAAIPSVTVADRVCYYKNEKVCAFDRFRVESGEPIRVREGDVSPYDVISLVHGILEGKVSAYMDEILRVAAKEFRLSRMSDAMAKYIEECIAYGEAHSIFLRSISDRISLC